MLDYHHLPVATGIYKITNLIDGKFYIGRSKNIRHRGVEHVNCLKNNKHQNKYLQRSFNKYGIENFKIEVVELCEDCMAEEREQFYIDTLNATVNGYNLSSNSQGGTSYEHAIPVICLETMECFKSMSDAAKAYKVFANSIVNVCNHKTKSTKGYHFVTEKEYKTLTKADIEEIIDFQIARKIIRLKDKKIFKSSYEVMKLYNYSCKSTVLRICKNSADKKYSTLKGDKFMYLDDYNNMSEEDIKFIENLKPTENITIPIICLDNKIIYNSVTEASKALNVGRGNITNCCQRTRWTASGYHFLYLDDYEKTSEEEINKILYHTNVLSGAQKVYCKELNTIYLSATKAQEATGAERHQITDCCKGLRECTTNGLHFSYA